MGTMCDVRMEGPEDSTEALLLSRRGEHRWKALVADFLPLLIVGKDLVYRPVRQDIGLADVDRLHPNAGVNRGSTCRAGAHA